MMEYYNQQTQQQQQSPIQFQKPIDRQTLLDWVMKNPSIPLSLRKQFYVLWELVPLGNYSEKDIKLLMSKFRVWKYLILASIPEQEWTNELVFQPDTEGEEPLRLDWNTLLEMLEQLYYIQLTRGKEGFTLKEVNTVRGHIISSGERLEERRGIRLF